MAQKMDSGYRRFRFIKPFTCEDGSFKVGDEITMMPPHHVFFNGGMVQPAYRELLLDLVEYEIAKGFDVLKEVAVPYNKA